MYNTCKNNEIIKNIRNKKPIVHCITNYVTANDCANAVLAIEDHNFYEHSGINIKRILGAVVKNIKSGYKAQGASTITQQLSKNLYLTIIPPEGKILPGVVPITIQHNNKE